MSNYVPPPKELPPGSIVVVYLRDSGGNSQELSVQQQIEEIKKYCQQHGLILIVIFSDIAKTGTTEVGRDGLYDLIDYIKNAKQYPNGLLLWGHDRFGRNFQDSTYYKAWIRKLGIVVHSITDYIPEGPYGPVIEAFIDLSNQERSRQNARDVRRALEDNVENGYSNGGTPPRGYIAEKVTIGQKRDRTPRIVSRWIPDPELWDLAKLAWKLRKEGKTFSEIREATGGRLYKDKHSWTTFFRNKSYLGIGKFGELEIPNHHPALIDQETWDKVQSLRKAAPRFGKEGQSQHPRRVNKPTLLSGIAHCIHCGSAIAFKIMNPNYKPWPSYLCGKKARKGWKSCEGRSINQPNADKAILDAFIEKILTVDYFYNLLDETKAQMSNTEEIEIKFFALEKSLKECERAITNLLDLAETFGAKSAIDRLQEREVEKMRILHELTSLKVKKQAAQLEISPEALTLALETWQKQVIKLKGDQNIRDLQNILKYFISDIKLGYNKAIIWYSYPIQENQLSAPLNEPFTDITLGTQSLTIEWK